MTILIYLNPLAEAKYPKRLATLISELESRQLNYLVYRSHLDQQINQQQFAAHIGRCTQIICIGGDGTLNQLINLVAEAPIPIGVLPSGTGNDFIRNLGIDKKNMYQVAISGQTKEVFLAQCNERYFLNVAGIGFDSALVDVIEKAPRNRFRSLVYVWHALRTIPSFREPLLKLTHDSGKAHKETFLLAIANGRFFGNGMKIAPYANPFANQLDCYHIGRLGLLSRLSNLVKIFIGKHHGHKSIDYFKSKHIHVETKGLPVEVDGEYAGQTPATFMQTTIKIPFKHA